MERVGFDKELPPVYYNFIMGKAKQFYYVVDKLNKDSAETIRASLNVVPEIEKVFVSVTDGVIEVYAKKNVEKQVEMACDVAGALFRTSVKKKSLL